MKTKQLFCAVFVLCFLKLCFSNAYAGNLDPNKNGLQYAYGENIGWINFETNIAEPNVGATVTDSNFTGFIWAENIGWINFGLANYYIVACKVKFEDLANFAEDWLDSGSIPGNLDGFGDVDFKDYSIFAGFWLDFCPDSWPVK